MILEHPFTVTVKHLLKNNINVPNQKGNGQQQKKNKRNGKLSQEVVLHCFSQNLETGKPIQQTVIRLKAEIYPLYQYYVPKALSFFQVTQFKNRL